MFTELIQQFGVKGLQVEELYSMDDETFAQMGAVHGLIFLFKWQKEVDNRPTLNDPNGQGIFFANQVINNACATQAILSILLNAGDIDIGETLRTFKAFTKDFSPEMKGEAINNSPDIQKAHNSFARPEHFVEYDKSAGGDSEDTFHFIAYLPIKGKLFELDGLKDGPVCLGDCDPSDGSWLSTVRPHINERINRYSAKEIRFNLMAIIEDRRDVLQRRIAHHEARAARLAGSSGDAGTGDAMEEEGFEDVRVAIQDGDKVVLDEMRKVEELQVGELRKRLAAAEDIFNQWKVDNIRRKHNYIPFIVKVLKILAKKKQLHKLIKKAEEKRMQREADLKAKR